MENKKPINDHIHGIFTIPKHYFQIIDTPIFQRTRSLHQLGSIYFVFPSASHYRLEHSLGTTHLANKFINQLKLNYPDREINDSIIKSLTVASLTHNIGHPPFSYAFNDFVRTSLGHKNWSHEEMSIKLLDDIIDSTGYDISTNELELAKDMITGREDYEGENAWMYQILHNKTNGVDIDKFDFIARDTRKFGIGIQAFDFNGLMSNVRLLQDNICYNINDAFQIYELFTCRYRLFKEFYLHRVSKGIDLMLSDIFKLADPVYKFQEYLDDTDKYVKLNDGILEEILYSKNESLNPAKELIQRIKKRNIYKHVTERIRYSDDYDYDKLLAINETDIANYGINIKPEDIKIMKVSLDYGKSDKDPFDYVKFYEGDNIVRVNKSNVSNIIPNRYKELTVRLYVKDPEKTKEARESFNKYCQEKLKEEPTYYEKNLTRSAKKLTYK